MSDFYYVEPLSASRWMWLAIEPIETETGVLELSPATGDDFDRVTRGDVAHLARPPRFSPVNNGKKLADLIWTTGSQMLASDAFVSALSDAQVTGWSTYEVDAVDKKGKPIPGVHGFAVHGETDPWRDQVDPSTVVEEDLVRYAVGFDPRPGWDGSDVFQARQPMPSPHCIMTARAIDALERAGVRHFNKTPMTEHRVALLDF